jgi:Predicted Zn-dependent protease (DUF2268)
MALWKSLYAGMFGVVAAATWLSAGNPPEAVHSLEIADRVAKFEAFYAKATAKPLDEGTRWALWKKEYDIAAVPPGLDGDKMARQLLDSAWVKYPALMPKIPALRKEAEVDAHEAFDKINVLFETKGTPIHSRLVLYVGQFDDNAYTVPPMGGHLATVMMPVENVQLRLALAHELTHSVHIQLAHVRNSFGAPIGETMFLEGLAMRAAQRVFPGSPEAAYTANDDKGWLAECYRKKDAVLASILPDLDKSGSEIAMKYTFGQGNNGLHREAYCAAWIVMGKLLDAGRTFPELARIPESRMVGTIKDTMAAEVAVSSWILPPDLH